MMDWIGIDDLLLLINDRDRQCMVPRRAHGFNVISVSLVLDSTLFCFGSILLGFVCGKMIHRLAIEQWHSPAVLEDD